MSPVDRAGEGKSVWASNVVGSVRKSLAGIVPRGRSGRRLFRAGAVVIGLALVAGAFFAGQHFGDSGTPPSRWKDESEQQATRALTSASNAGLQQQIAEACDREARQAASDAEARRREAAAASDALASLAPTDKDHDRRTVESVTKLAESLAAARAAASHCEFAAAAARQAAAAASTADDDTKHAAQASRHAAELLGDLAKEMPTSGPPGVMATYLQTLAREADQMATLAEQAAPRADASLQAAKEAARDADARVSDARSIGDMVAQLEARSVR